MAIRKQTVFASLDGNSTASKDRDISASLLRDAVEEFKKKIKRRRGLEVDLAESGEIAKIDERIRAEVPRPEAIKSEDLAKNREPGGRNPQVTCSV